MRILRLFLAAAFIGLFITSCNQKPVRDSKDTVQTASGSIITATVYNSGFEHSHDTYNGLSTASDGKVYYVLCSELMDVAGQMYSLDPKTGQIEHLGDLTEMAEIGRAHV